MFYLFANLHVLEHRVSFSNVIGPKIDVEIPLGINSTKNILFFFFTMSLSVETFQSN